jgi:hypothetical protein
MDMEMQELEISIDKEGRVLMQVRGVHRDECLAVTKDLENAIGTVSERNLKPEYYEQTVTNLGHRHISR